MAHFPRLLLLGRREESENPALCSGMCLVSDGGGGRFGDREQAEMDTAFRTKSLSMVYLQQACLANSAPLPGLQEAFLPFRL